MNEANNPFSPGAGSPPPELAGRSAILEQADMVFQRAQNGRQFRSLMLVGLRGVGKTVLLSKIAAHAEARYMSVAQIEAPEGKRLGELLAPELRRILLKMNVRANVADKSRRALNALRNFVGKFKIAVGDFEVTLSPEEGLADSGDLETDLTALLAAIGEAAKEKKTALVLLIDEMQYLNEDDFAALIMALHKISQKSLPVVLIGAGLPQLVGNAGRAKSYAERLFDYPPVGPLLADEAARAVRVPLEAEGCSITDDGMLALYTITEGYPFFLQAWAYAVWNAAAKCPITVDVVNAATPDVIAMLDKSFFRVRFDRLTPREKDYVRAMAEMGVGPLRSGDIASALGRSISSLAPLRASLIKKGMVYSPAHGDTAFTVPLFDQFLKRAMPRDVV
jgi:nucleoside-triphosphatase THEP1